MRAPGTSVVAAALSGVLCSGITAAVMRVREPDVVAIKGPLQLTVDQQHLLALLVHPGPSWSSPSTGAELPATGDLTARGYVRGWARTYKQGADQLDAFIFEFDTDEGATGYATGLGGTARLLSQPVPFDPRVPGANGLADTVKDASGHYLRLVALSRGTRAVVLVFRDDAAAPTAAVLLVIRRQYDLLGEGAT